MSKEIKTAEFVPYGDEWQKEMNKQSKQALIFLLSEQFKNNRKLIYDVK
jgi:hypothetical protein